MQWRNKRNPVAIVILFGIAGLWWAYTLGDRGFAEQLMAEQ